MVLTNGFGCEAMSGNLDVKHGNCDPAPPCEANVSNVAFECAFDEETLEFLGMRIRALIIPGPNLNYRIVPSVGGTMTPSGGVLQAGWYEFIWTPPPGFSQGDVFFTLVAYGASSYCVRSLNEATGPMAYDENECLGERGKPGRKDSSYVKNEKEAAQLQLVPNPAYGRTTVNYRFEARKGSNRQIALYDMMGRLMKTQAATEKGYVQLDLGNQPAGMYLVVMKQDGKVVKTGKLLVRRGLP
jgi:hypothetical protein